MNLENVYAVINYAEDLDRRSGNGGVMTRITFTNLKNFATYDTYVCPGHRNAKNWQEILQKRESGLIVQGLKLKQNGGKVLVNADSKPEIVWEGTIRGLENRILKLHKPAPNNYGDLFE